VQEQTIPISVLVKEMSPEEHSELVACIGILHSMYLDYHDTKAHPQMSLDEDVDDCQLSEQDADPVRRCLKPKGYRGAELIAAGAPPWLLKRLEVIRWDGKVDTDHLEWAAAEITCGGRTLACFIPFRYLLDLNDASKVYSV
jgi:hypothetical protein